MAQHNFSRVQALNKEVKIISGKFSIAASGGAATKLRGLGFTVAKSNTGEYTVTLLESYNCCLSANFTVQAETPVDLVPQIVSEDVVGNKTVVVNLNTGAVPTEPSAVTVVNFVFMLQNSSVRSV